MVKWVPEGHYCRHAAVQCVVWTVHGTDVPRAGFYVPPWPHQGLSVLFGYIKFVSEAGVKY
jgi:hypothetical protein